MQNRYNIETLSRKPVSRACLETAPLANAPLRAAASNPPGSPARGGPQGDTVTGVGWESKSTAAFVMGLWCNPPGNRASRARVVRVAEILQDDGELVHKCLVPVYDLPWVVTNVKILY